MGSYGNTRQTLFREGKIGRMRKTKTLKDQRQKQQENGKAELEEIREDNIEAAKRQKSKIIKK